MDTFEIELQPARIEQSADGPVHKAGIRVDYLPEARAAFTATRVVVKVEGDRATIFLHGAAHGQSVALGLERAGE
jgi:hypothetical protein